MFKRLMIGLFALSLAAIWASEANAIVNRRRRTVENFHTCSAATDPCYDATSVTDALYGYDGTNITCQMTGYLFCNPDVIQAGVCPVAENEPVGLTEISYTETATFVDQTAENLTVLDIGPGQAACDSEYPPAGSTTFEKFWPNRFVAHSIYIFDGGTRDGDPPYELIEDCTLQTNDPEYLCTKLWDSSSAGPPPKLPCCGEDNTLTVKIVGQGTVTSDPAGINCVNNSGDCSETYDDNVEPYDGCPEVVLTATGAAPGWEPEWSGGGCSGTGPTCTTSAKDSPTVTVTFIDTWFTLTVYVNGDGSKDKAYIWEPRENFDDPNVFYCVGPSGDTTPYMNPCTKRFAPLTPVVVKRKGGKVDPDTVWELDCEGVPNSIDDCALTMDSNKLIKINFSNP